MALRKSWEALQRILKTLVHRIRLWQYYAHDNDRPKSLLAFIADLVFLQVFIFCVSYLWFVYNTKSPIFSLGMALSLTILITVAIYLQKRKAYNQKRREKRRDIARKYLLNRINKLSHDEFQWQLMQLLLNTQGFSSVNPRGGLLEAVCSQNKIAVGFHHIPYNESTPPEEVWKFIQLARSLNYKYGIFISSASFKEGCYDIVKEVSGLSIRLINSSQLLNMMENAGMTPHEKVVDKLIAQELEQRIHQWNKIKKEILTPRKIRSYMVFAILFAVAALLFRTLSLYLIGLSLTFLLFALIIRLLSSGKQHKESDFPIDLPIKQENEEL